MDLPGNVATVGRDPSSDLVLNDPKCSRRHAVIEAGGDGVTIRDSGSANGVYVNGRKTDRARIRAGDLVKLGDVVLTLLAEPISGTVVMEDLDMPGASGRGRSEDDEPARLPEPGPRPSALPGLRTSRGDPADLPADAPEALAVGARAGHRPLTITVLAILWGLSIPVYVVGGFALSWQALGAGRAALVAAGLLLALVCAAMAGGLWLARPWAYPAQIAAAAFGLLVCPFTLASIAVLVYMLRPAVRWHFSDRREPEPADAGQAEAMFVGSLLGAVVLGVLLTAALTFLARTARTRSGSLLGLTPGAEAAALDQLRALAAAEDAFHSVCNTGYGDLVALRRPGSVIPDYPKDGPAFLRGADFDAAERGGYRYTLSVEDEMPRAPGCPLRRFRRFLYSAAPVGSGRALAVGPDGVVRAAEGRAATLEDPPAEPTR